MASTPKGAAAVDKRRLILDAAVVVFARQGYGGCRVSDIADEAGVAYGLVYHYFRSKDEILDTLFLERWNVLLEAIREVDRETDPPLPAREKLYAIVSFIVDSYRHDPDLMKVIIVEVTRAANTFGRSHLAEIREAYDGIARIVEKAQASGEFKATVTPTFAAMAFYGAIEQVLTGWIFDVLPGAPEDVDQAKAFVVETIDYPNNLQKGDLGFDNARVVVPKDIWRSILYQRAISLDDAVKMPPLARSLVGLAGVVFLAGCRRHDLLQHFGEQVGLGCVSAGIGCVARHVDRGHQRKREL